MNTNTNFDYLKNIDKNLFEMISEAEKLYRDEYFEQCMTQTRRFGEHICRNVLGKNRTTEITFDEMLATLKDKVSGEEQEKEFIDDLYFLKKQGNISTHSFTIQKNSTTALECLQRAFEAGINYCVYFKKENPAILKLSYDTELLVTGKKPKKSLSDKYYEEKEKFEKEQTKKVKKTSSSKKKRKKQVATMSSIPRKTGISPYWIFVGISFLVACFVMIFMLF